MTLALICCFMNLCPAEQEVLSRNYSNLNNFKTHIKNRKNRKRYAPEFQELNKLNKIFFPEGKLI